MSVTSVIIDDEPGLRHARRPRDPQQPTSSTLPPDSLLLIAGGVTAEAAHVHHPDRLCGP
jgi:hypothetical protein